MTPDPEAANSNRPLGRSDVVFRSLAEEWVLYDPVSNQVHVLNLSAALVWTACTGENTVEEIVQEMAESFPDQPPLDTVRTDVDDALEQFSHEGLLDDGTSS